MTAILVPDLGDGISSVEVASWLCAEGAMVNKDDDLVEVVTDKASFHIAAPASGTLKVIRFAAGQEAAIGSILGEIA